MTLHLAYIGLGSNLNNPQQQIEKAIEALKLLSEDGQVNCSALYQTSPMIDEVEYLEGFEEKANIQPDYVNAVVSINTFLEPLDLLNAVQRIEHEQGRIRNAKRWIARTLDLDILLIDNMSINHPRLTVPHYGLKQRNFVIYPLADLDVNLVLPDGTTLKELHQSCSSKGISKID